MKKKYLCILKTITDNPSKKRVMKTNCYLKACLFLIIGTLATIQPTFSAPITRQQAQQNVSEFLQGKGINVKRMAMRHAPMSQEEENAPYYVFNIGDDNGFVIAAGDDRAYSILGYSDSGHLDTDSMPDGMKYMLDFYAQQIAAAPETAESVKKKATSSHPAVEPMLTTKWHQTYPYNANCPLENGERCVTGCVATAMAQVLYYHRNKSTNKVVKTIPDSYGYLGYDILAGSVIDWDNMIDDYKSQDYTEEQAQAVANLMLYCGLAVRMGYGTDGSYAYSQDVPNALSTYFDYFNPRYEERKNFTDTKWENMIYTELEGGNPIYYGGGSHAFVIDGHDGNGYVHVNWGWGGYRDNYFLLSAVEDTRALNGYDSNQVAVFSDGPNDRDLETVTLSLLSNPVVENISTLASIPLEIELEVKNTNAEDLEEFYVDVWPQKDGKSFSWFEKNVDEKVAIVSYNQKKKLRRTYAIPTNIASGVYKFEPYCDRYNSSTSTLTERGHRINHDDLYISMIIKDDKATFYVGKPDLGGEIIKFKSSLVKNICIDNWDFNGDREISTDELDYVTDLGTCFKDRSISTFDELQYFKNLTSIGKHAFDGTRALKSIIIPKNVKSISSCAFTQKTYLSSIAVDKDNPWYDSRNDCNAIIETSSNTLVVGCKNTVIPNEILVIEDNAFNGCYQIRSITIPKGVTKIGNNAFNGCLNLQYFGIPDSVTQIGDYAFKDTRPSSYLSITIPKKVKSIGTGVFSYTSINRIEVDPDNPWYDSRNNCNAIIETASNKLIAGCRNTDVPDDVNAIGESAFEGMEGLSHIELPMSVKSIGNYAFKESDIKSIEIWNVEDYRYSKEIFNGCDSLTSIQLNKSTPPNKVYASLHIFSNKTFDKATLYVPIGSKAAYESAQFWGKFSNIVEREDTVAFYNDQVKQICVDNWDISGDGEVSRYELSQVKELGHVFAYFGNQDIDDPWYGPMDVRKKERPLYGEDVFFELRYFTGLTSIDDYEFEGSSIWDVSLPENLTKIGNYAFENLSSIYIPTHVKSIGYKAFGNHLEWISVSPYNKWYDSRNDCNALIETATNTLIQGCMRTVIPDDVEIIGVGAFDYCEFSSITIPKSVREIGSCAFMCGLVNSIKVNWYQPIEINEDVFYGPWYKYEIYESATLYVPRGTKAAYQAAEGWKRFSKIEEYGSLAGDVNGDGVVNITDVTMTVNHVLGNHAEAFDETVADMNDDGKINISDVSLIVGVVLNGQQ